LGLVTSLATVVAVCLALVLAHDASANGSLSAGLDDQVAFGEPDFGDIDANMVAAKSDIGAQTIRIHVTWLNTLKAADKTGCTVPARDWANPASYDTDPSSPLGLTRIDRQIARARDATLGGKALRIFLVFNAPFPCWASYDRASGRCAPTATCVWRPDLGLYRKWIHAMMSRYGTLVNRVSPWNEPNNPSFLTGGTDVDPRANVRQRALIFRDMWFTARDEIKLDPALQSLPLWYGELQESPNLEAFVKDAFCYGDPLPAVRGVEKSVDTRYQSCDGTDRVVDAEALTFHAYLSKANTPENNLDYLKNLRQWWQDIRAHGLSTPSYFAATEAGVHNGQAYGTDVDTTGNVAPDGTAQSPVQTPEAQAAQVNCLEHNMFSDPRLVGIIQFGYKDAPHGRGGTTYTALRFRDGPEKLAYAAWRMPFTVWWRADGLEVWGAYRPGDNTTRPATITIEGLAADGTRVYTAAVTPNKALYANGYFLARLANAPTSVTFWRARVDPNPNTGPTSRIATTADCGSNWGGGDPRPTVPSPT
jgi:hypothetical protein